MKILNIFIVLSGVGVISACYESYRIFQHEGDVMGSLFVYLFGAGTFALLGIAAGRKKTSIQTSQEKQNIYLDNPNVE